jgi:hypothetical protein
MDEPRPALTDLVGRPVLIIPTDDSDQRYIAWIVSVSDDGREFVMQRRPVDSGD